MTIILSQRYLRNDIASRMLGRFTLSILVVALLSACSDRSSSNPINSPDTNTTNEENLDEAGGTTETGEQQSMPTANASFSIEQLEGRWQSPCFFRPELQTGNAYPDSDHVRFEFEYADDFANMRQYFFNDECLSESISSVGFGGEAPFGGFVTTEEGLLAVIYFDNAVTFSIDNVEEVNGTTSFTGSSTDERFIDIIHFSNGQLFFGDLSSAASPLDPPTRLDLNNPWIFLGPVVDQ